MTRIRSGVARIAAASLLLLAFAAPAQAADSALVRVLHASPDAPAVDVHGSYELPPKPMGAEGRGSTDRQTE